MGLPERANELGNLRLVGIADDPGNAWEGGEFFRGALGIATGGDDSSGGVGGMDFADCFAGLGVRGSRNCAGVDHDEIGGGGGIGGFAAAIEELALDGSAISLRGAAAELLDEKGSHAISCLLKR